MAHFTTAPVSEVITRTAAKNTGARKQAQSELTNALRESVAQQLALIVELDEEDKPLTVLNRIHRAAETLGIDVKARKVRNQNKIVAYAVPEGDAS